MLDISEKTDLLSSTELFKLCGKEMIEQIAKFCTLRNFPKGEIIFRNGDGGETIFFVKSGEISVLQRMEDRQEIEIARYSRGDFFGEVDMLMGTPRNAEAQAAEDNAPLVALLKSMHWKIVERGEVFRKNLA